MQKKKKMMTFVLLSIVLNQAFAQLEINTFTANNGGGKSESATYKVTASIGQTDASKTLASSNFSVIGGFWSSITSINDDVIFKNGFED